MMITINRLRVDTVVVSTQHDADAKQKTIKEDVIEHVVKKNYS